MIVHHKDGYWEYPADVRICTVNTQGVMGAGIALEFKKRYPAMFEDYKACCSKGEVKPGGLYIWHKEPELIVCIATKDEWRNKSKYEWIENGLKELKELLDTITKDNKLVKLSMPALGCANGGLNWMVVRQMIIDELADQPHEIAVFSPL